MTLGRSTPARLLAALAAPLLIAGCKSDDLGGPPRDTTVTLDARVASDLGEKILFLLSALPEFGALDAFSDFGSLFLTLTGSRVSNVTVSTNLSGAAAQQSFQAVAVTLSYRNVPPGTSLPPVGGIIAFRAGAAGQLYTDFAYAFAPAGVGSIPGSGGVSARMAIVAGTAANGYAGTLTWIGDEALVSLGQGAGTDPCPNSGLLALAAPGVTCATQFFPGTFTITTGSPVAPATGTKQAALPHSRIIGVALSVDCEASTLC